MQLLTTMLTLAACLASIAVQAAPLNMSREYHVRTCLKPGQPGKERFENLYLYSYHTGAGLGDATFDKNLTEYAPKGYLTAAGTGTSFQNFDLGTEFPWTMVMVPNQVFYSAWQPVRINAGGGSTNSTEGLEDGFFINSTGLQWTTSNKDPASDEFGGWLVCNWWHTVPQLFFRISYENYPKKFTPCSCADVYLIPEYL